MSIKIFPVGKKFDEARNKWAKFPKTNGKSWLTYNATDAELAQSDNIGIVIPAGVMVIDMDTDKGVTHADIENALGCELEWGEAVLQKTVSGGFHYGFVVDAELEIKQGSDLFGVIGFDTRVTSKGWICSGDGYTDEGMDDVANLLANACDWLPLLPSVAVDKLTVSVADDFDMLDDLDSAIAEQTLDITNEEVKEYLAALPAHYSEDGDAWYKVGMAVFHQTGGSEEGYRLFDDFSALNKDKYNERQNRNRWNSFKVDGVNPLTFASVIHWSGGKKALVSTVERKSIEDLIDNATTVNDINQCLVETGQRQINSLNVEILLKSIQTKFKLIAGSAPPLNALRKIIKSNRPNELNGNFVDDHVFIQAHNEYMNIHNKTTMVARAFDTSFGRLTPPNSEGEKQNATTFADSSIKVVNLCMYAPVFDTTFSHEQVEYANLYRPSLLKPVIGDGSVVERVKKHVAHILPDEVEQSIFINYLAHNVQQPGKKLYWAIILQGVEGDGKSFFSEMMQSILGIHNVRSMSALTLESNFSGWAVGQCMSFIEELKLDSLRKFDVLNNLKPYITNQSIEVTLKGRDPIVSLNTTNYVALTNYKDAIPVSDNDRRYCVLFSQWQQKEQLNVFKASNPTYYKDLYDDMRNNTGELLHWLQSHEISKEFLSYIVAPETTAKFEMIHATKSEGQLSLEDALVEFECDDINDKVINVTRLKELVEVEWSRTKHQEFPINLALKKILNNMGYSNVGRIKNSQRQNQTFYAKDKDTDLSLLMNEAPF